MRPEDDGGGVDDRATVPDRRVEQRPTRHARRVEDRWNLWEKRIRDAVIFAIGAAGCVYVIFIDGNPSATVVVILAGLTGLPLVLGADEKRNRDRYRD